MSWEIHHADAREMPFIDDDSVDLIVTSPPYWGLRSYRDAGEHYDGQIGSEDTPQQFVDELVSMIDSEWRRVLKPVGSLWLNLGDKYSAKRTPQVQQGGLAANEVAEVGQDTIHMAPAKSLLGLPWRVALALIDRGWILRAEVIWSKPNGLPESVTDRVRRSHEQWFHFVLEPRYFSAVDEIREPAANPKATARAQTRDATSQDPRFPDRMDGRTFQPEQQSGVAPHPLGRLPGSVWTVPTEPLIIPDAVKGRLGLVDHFAAFPQEWPRRLIMGWSPSGICEACGEGLRPVVERTPMEWEPSGRQNDTQLGPRPTSGKMTASPTTSIDGYECGCDEPGTTRPSVVLDPFGGTGTTAGVAHALGRHGISVDLSADYCRLAEWRISQSGHFSKSRQRMWADRQEQLL